jgi:hypothetical protein
MYVCSCFDALSKKRKNSKESQKGQQINNPMSAKNAFVSNWPFESTKTIPIFAASRKVHMYIHVAAIFLFYFLTRMNLNNLVVRCMKLCCYYCY